VIWLAVVVAAGYFTRKCFLAGQTTRAQDEAISETYGMAAGFGLAVLCVTVLKAVSRLTSSAAAAMIYAGLR
jgi:hypothetical protein